MYFKLISLSTLFLIACTGKITNPQSNTEPVMNQAELKNEKTRNYKFLNEMYQDSYFPRDLVDKGKQILVDLCNQIEQRQIKNLEELYALSKEATEKFNDLEEEFIENESEMETAARECIAMDFAFIANAYGFKADVEELISVRNW